MNEHAHDSYLERHEDEIEQRIEAVRQELLASLIVRRIDKDAFSVEKIENCNNYHIVTVDNEKSRCSCAWSIFIKHADCIHITAAKKFIKEERP